MKSFSNELTMNDFKLKDGNYIIKKNNGKKGLLLVYAPWCGYSKMIGPEWREFNKNKKYFVTALNVEKKNSGNKIIAKELNISGYPTIKYVNKDGKVLDTYDSDRNIEGFIKYLSEK